MGSHFISFASVKLQLKKEFQESDVTVHVKVMGARDTETVGAGKTNQVVVVAASATLTVWEADVGKLVVGSSYQIIRFSLSAFQGKHHLFWPLSGASICEIANIGKVVEDESDILDIKAKNRMLW